MSYPLLAHVGENHNAVTNVPILSNWELFKAGWHWDPLALAGVTASLGIYFFAFKCKWNRKGAYFTAGNLVILLALVSPIATLGESYLFSVHMVQHLLLEIIAVPLLVIGLPAKLSSWPLRWTPFRRLAKLLGRPGLAWIIGVGTLWIWHLPVLYNLTLESKTIHILEHLSFVVSAIIFWYPLLDPIGKYRLSALPAVLYLFSACLVNSLLAILLTFAPAGLYPYYLNPEDVLGALYLIREVWGILPEIDQQMGGAIMWVLGGVVFLAVLIGVLVRWYRKPDVPEPWERTYVKEKS